MPMLRIENFGGMHPLKDSRLLPNPQAALSQNAFVQSGMIRCLTSLIPIYTVQNSSTRCVFRVPKFKYGIDNMADSYWLEFPNENTWVVRNPQSGLLASGGTFYWADGNQSGYTTLARLEAGLPPLTLGIPSPTVAPGVTTTGGVGPVETRAYVYTWMASGGEEGQPSPPTVHSGPNDAVWHITMTAPTPADTANRDLTTTRLYRTVTGPQGVATFFFVTEFPITTLTYDDVIPDATVALNDELNSTNWAPPPPGLNGLVNMPNGMIAGFSGQEIWFCEPYRPWAWPPQYVIGVEAPIVGLGVQQQSLVILTVGFSYMATGISPDAMALTKVVGLEPCTAMGSIVSAPEGVMYTSVNGLIVVSAGVGINATAELIRKDQWPKFLYLPVLHASYFSRSYFACSAPNDGVFQTDTFQTQLTEAGDPAHDTYQTKDFSGTRDGIYVALAEPTWGMSIFHSDTPVQNVLMDIWTGETMLLRGGVVEHVDLRQFTRFSDFLWRSKIFQTPFKENWAAAKVFYNEPPVPVDHPTKFRVYADNSSQSLRLVFERDLPGSGVQFRLPSGFKYDFMQFELQGQHHIQNVQIATSARELRNA